MYRELFRCEPPRSLVLAQNGDRLLILREGIEIEEFAADDGGLKAAIKRYMTLILANRPKPPEVH